MILYSTYVHRLIHVVTKVKSDHGNYLFHTQVHYVPVPYGTGTVSLEKIKNRYFGSNAERKQYIVPVTGTTVP